MDVKKIWIRCMLLFSILAYAYAGAFSNSENPAQGENKTVLEDSGYFTLLSFGMTTYLGMNLGLEKQIFKHLGVKAEAGFSPLYDRPYMCLTGGLLGVIYANPDDEFFNVNFIFGLLDYLHNFPRRQTITLIQANLGGGLMFRLNWSRSISTDLSIGVGYLALLTGESVEEKTFGKGRKGPGLSLHAGVNYRIF